MEAEERTTAILERAIREHLCVRLVYRRKSDEVVSVHEIAPLDIREGWTEKTATTLYLWAWCFAESQAEMHVLERVIGVTLLNRVFQPPELLRRWPTDRWPLPDAWRVQRDWRAES